MAIEIQTNQSDCEKMKKLLSLYHKFSDLGKYIPYKLGKARSLEVYVNIVQEHNWFLRDIDKLEVFGLHIAALELRIEDEDELDNTLWPTLEQKILGCYEIVATEETSQWIEMENVS